MGYANVSRPMGFKYSRPVGKEDPFVWPRPIAAIRQASAGGNASRDLAIGDAYSLDANGNAYRAGPNDSIKGIVLSFRLVGNSAVMQGAGPISTEYSPNGNADTLLGIEDKTTIFEVQADNFLASMVGGQFNITDAAPDSGLAQSRQIVTTAAPGAQVQAIDVVSSLADNAYGTNARIYVRLLQGIED